MVTGAPSVRQRRLGIELRRLRERRALTAEEIASRLNWSSSKLSRVENARIGIRVADVRLLLELYEVDQLHMGEILALAQSTTSGDWWQAYRHLLSTEFAKFVALEDEADSALHYNTHIAPGLLQTKEYAKATLESAAAIWTTSPREIEQRLEIRMRRQQLLTKKNPLDLSVVLDESALMRPIGDSKIMQGQLHRLIETAALPNVNVYILRLAAQRKPVMGETFTLLRFTPAYEVDFPDVAYIDSLAGMEFQEDSTTFRYKLAWEKLQASALTADESIQHMIRLAESTKEP